MSMCIYICNTIPVNCYIIKHNHKNLAIIGYIIFYEEYDFNNKKIIPISYVCQKRLNNFEGWHQYSF